MQFDGICASIIIQHFGLLISYEISSSEADFKLHVELVILSDCKFNWVFIRDGVVCGAMVVFFWRSIPCCLEAGRMSVLWSGNVSVSLQMKL